MGGIKMKKKIVIVLSSLAMILTVALVALVIFTVIRDRTLVWEGPCTFKFWSKSERGQKTLKMNLDCNYKGKEVATTNVDIILSYLQRPRSLSCIIFKSGRVECK